jgi:hypothetical protein
MFKDYSTELILIILLTLYEYINPSMWGMSAYDTMVLSQSMDNLAHLIFICVIQTLVLDICCII